MRNKSNKRKAKERKIRPIERDWLEAHTRCWCCGGQTQCIHHMARGNRHIAIVEPCCWFAACLACNAEPLEQMSVWPLERQLAAKRHNDAGEYDRVKFNRCRGRADNAIAGWEVERWYTEMYGVEKPLEIKEWRTIN